MRSVFSISLLLFAAAEDEPLIAGIATVDEASTPSAGVPASHTTIPYLPTSLPVPLNECVLGLENAGTYSCGAVCKPFDKDGSGNCSGNPKWSLADIIGSCGASVEHPCSVVVSKYQDPTGATCGQCYALTKRVGTRTKTIFAKVISVDSVDEPAAKFQLPSAVFHATCPFQCKKGGCALIKEDCVTEGGVGIYDDCVVQTGRNSVSVEQYNIKLVECEAGGSNKAVSMVAYFISAGFVIHQLAI